MSEENKKDYEFVTETIKKKPVNKKRLALKTLYSIGLGIVAGLVACVVFAIFSPKIYSKINPDEPNLISIPQDEQTSENLEIDSSQNYTEKTDSINTEPVDSEKIEVDKVTEENTEIENPEEEVSKTSEDEKEQEAIVEEKPEEEKGIESSEDENNSEDNVEPEESTKTVVIQKEEITLDDYKKFYRELAEVSNVAKRSLVKVTGVTDQTDWFNNAYESGNVSSGLIVADNGKELLIITNAEKLIDSKEIEVTFCDSKSYKGSIKKADPSTGLVVVAVVLEDIEELTKNSYSTATLGNSNLPTLVGTPVIALGSPLGIEDSMAIGLVTSNTRDIRQTDSNIRYITTDIYGSIEGSGVIVDLDGRVLGIIFQGGTSADTKNLIHAYSISDIKSKIEKLSNGQDTAYLGIVGTDVTKKAMEELSVPEGAYVSQVVVDSPAMNSGIQNGDVIVKLGTTDIRSFSDYKVAMNKCQPGDTAMVTVKRLGKDGYVEFSYEIYLEALK